MTQTGTEKKKKRRRRKEEEEEGRTSLPTQDNTTQKDEDKYPCLK
jgi:hypothetical protein